MLKKKKKSFFGSTQPSEEEGGSEDSHSSFAEASSAQEPVEVDQKLFNAFSLGDVKRVDSAPDDKAPT